MKLKAIIRHAMRYVLFVLFIFFVFSKIVPMELKRRGIKRMKYNVSKAPLNINALTFIRREITKEEKKSKANMTSKTKIQILFTANRKIYDNNHLSTAFEYFYNESSSENLQNPLLHKHQFQFILNNDQRCVGKHVFIIIFIHVAPKEIAERQMIRSTYGSLLNINEKHIVYIFVLGMTSNKTLQKDLEEESSKYNDIVQSNFYDSYKNLTYKQVLGLYWVKTFCNHSKFVIKTDSDVIVNTPAVVKHLVRKTGNNRNNIDWNVIECKNYLSDSPERHPHSKWYITNSEYQFSKYPPYCIGLALIMSTGVAEKLLEATKLVPFFWIDDVYVSGFLPWVARIKLSKPDNFFQNLPDTNNNVSFLFYTYQGKGASRLNYLENKWKSILLNSNVK